MNIQTTPKTVAPAQAGTYTEHEPEVNSPLLDRSMDSRLRGNDGLAGGVEIMLRHRSLY